MARASSTTTDVLNNNLKAALAYARNGRKILPLWWIKPSEPEYRRCACGQLNDAPNHKPGKHPLGKLVFNGSADATNDLDVIRDWWTLFPYANIGGLVGKDQGLIVFDADKPKPGETYDGLEEWQKILDRENHGQRFATPTVESGSGALHTYFRHLGDEVPTFRDKGIDVLADRKGEPPYVVLPPSNHISGNRYRWLNPPGTELLPYRELISPSANGSDGKENPVNSMNVKRHDGRFWPAMYAVMRFKAQQRDTALDIASYAIRHHALPGFCGDGPDCELSEATLERIRKEALKVYSEKHAPKVEAPKSYPLPDVSNILDDTVPARPRDLIDKIIEAGATHVEVVGHKGQGKTMTVQNMILRLCVGRPVFENYAVATPTTCLFIEEDSPSPMMERREAAIIKHLQLSETERELLRSNFIPLREVGFSFTDLEPLRFTLGKLKERGRPVKVIVVDSRSATWGEDQNDEQYARQTYKRMDALCRAFGCIFVIIGHPPKTEFGENGRLITLTIAGTAVHERHANTIIHIRKESHSPAPQISFEWNKVRDGLHEGTKVYFDAVIEPGPESRVDDDSESIFIPRGWVGLKPCGKDTIRKVDPVEQTADALITYLDEKPRAVVECELYIKNESGLGFGKSTVERALKLLKVRGHAVNPRPKSESAGYQLTETGRDYARLNGLNVLH
jgi:hypothetical protein